jgi:GNAT superfamily N-acetyltransferase
MTVDYDISLAMQSDIPGILALQEPNLPDSGGSLSVRLTADWFKNAILEKSVVAGRRNSQVVGYVLGTSLAAKAQVGIIQSMLRTFPPPPGCYPVCVAEAERGRGLAGALFEFLRTHMGNRSAMTFVRTDNAPSLQAHRKMGMRDLGPFVHEDVPYIAFKYSARSLSLACPLCLRKRTCGCFRPCLLWANSGHRLVYSITSLARARSVGTVRPSALAVLRLITSSYLVGSCTGRSDGFSPLRIRSTYAALRRHRSVLSIP